jgi:hypothetical protein
VSLFRATNYRGGFFSGHFGHFWGKIGVFGDSKNLRMWGFSGFLTKKGKNRVSGWSKVGDL